MKVTLVHPFSVDQVYNISVVKFKSFLLDVG